LVSSFLGTEPGGRRFFTSSNSFAPCVSGSGGFIFGPCAPCAFHIGRGARPCADRPGRDSALRRHLPHQVIGGWLRQRTGPGEAAELLFQFELKHSGQQCGMAVGSPGAGGSGLFPVHALRRKLKIFRPFRKANCR